RRTKASRVGRRADYSHRRIGAAAKVRGGRQIKIPGRAILDSLAGGAGRRRRRGVNYGNRLTAKGGVAATVKNKPDARGNKSIAAVTHLVRDQAENRYLGRNGAIVRRRRLIKSPCASRLHGFAGRTSDGGWRVIDKRYDLCACRAVSAGIEDFPHAHDRIAATASTVCQRAERPNYHIGAAAAIGGSRQIERPGAPAFDGFVCRAVYNGRRRVHDENGLAARGSPAAGIDCLPGACNDPGTPAHAIGRNGVRDGNANGHVRPTTEFDGTWKIEGPATVALHRLAGRTEHERVR